MARFGVPLESRKNLLLAHTHGLDVGLRERLEQRHLKGTIRLALAEPAPSGAIWEGSCSSRPNPRRTPPR